MGIEIDILRETIKGLNAENALLKHILNQKFIVEEDKSIWAENLVSKAVRGERTKKGRAFDVFSQSRYSFEVKYSSLCCPYARSKMLRWSWGNVLKTRERFMRLILIGEKDERYLDKYLDQTFPCVIFDVPYGCIQSLAVKCSGYYKICLNTNPSLNFRRYSKANILFKEYQVSLQDLASKYT